jgi:hypothetical protein
MAKQEKTRICPICGKQVAPRGYFSHIKLAHPGLEERTIVRQRGDEMNKLKGLPIETQNKISRIVELRKLRAEVEKSDDRSFLDGLFSDDDTQEVLLDRIDAEIKILREEIRKETENLKEELGIEEQED